MQRVLLSKKQRDLWSWLRARIKLDRGWSLTFRYSHRVWRNRQKLPQNLSESRLSPSTSQLPSLLKLYTAEALASCLSLALALNQSQLLRQTRIEKDLQAQTLHKHHRPVLSVALLQVYEQDQLEKLDLTLPQSIPACWQQEAVEEMATAWHQRLHKLRNGNSKSYQWQ